MRNSSILTVLVTLAQQQNVLKLLFDGFGSSLLFKRASEVPGGGLCFIASVAA